ncbi:protein S40-1-like [Typha angustifolia]|uniref:protein S40-1-like n=1 Tax=Typha angustifolia TaxID=59011 RepID=UPI003C2F95F2
MEEFEEADIMWPDHHHHHDDDDAGGGGGSSDDCTDIEVQILGRSKAAAAAVPVVVPAKDRVSHSWTLGLNFNDIYVDREDGGGGSNEEIVPPHILISRRFNDRHKKMAFSVCIGKGRTLKGRDLCHVRNSILRMTGFLER